MWSKGLHDGNDFGVHSRHTVRGRNGNGGVCHNDWSEEAVKWTPGMYFWAGYSAAATMALLIAIVVWFMR